ncbi:xaa-Pro aminopeptidase 3-like [Plodia interpunctella]|uniref:xaa-Pro aminopeptidase 3-like n=1 Tax=Plodia interpunctella TaxID=58824 RepID=UPI00236821B6|nr:xaa-Pro aminopeptidase 3-like [Plodia interpunctella]
MNSLRKLVFTVASRGRKRIFNQSYRMRSTKEVYPGLESVGHSIPKGIFGQPTCHTHPHLIRPEQLTCGITQAEYRERREMLVNKLVAEVGNEHKTHIIVIPGACKQYMSDKIPYVFRQNSDFFYLTGCLEPSAVLVMVKPSQTEEFKSILFVHDKDSHAELWEGPRTGCSAAAHLFAVDESWPVEGLGNFLFKTISSSKPALVWYHHETPANPEIHPTIRDVMKENDQVFIGDPQRALHFLRVIKSPAEIELMKETCYVGSQSVNMAMACTKPDVSEHMIKAILEYSSKQAGAEHLAFPPVVAGGPRATHIHYVANNQLLRHDEMILVDTGSQRWLYNSDISRTWPVSGKFSKHHRILYELVLAVQKRLIEILGEHRPALDQLFDSMCRLLGTQLQQEGILPKNIDGHELLGKAYRLCPHHVSHYLGLDVHDAPLVRRNIPVSANMIVTVEPGIYIRPDDESVPPEFRGVGIRIEDDVLITDNEPFVLTDAAVKEVNDIESIVGKHSL